MTAPRPFVATEILIPPASAFPAWPVVACDQFTAQPEYWQEADRIAGDKPSALRIMLPEYELEAPYVQDKIQKILKTMEEYVNNGLFRSYPNAMIYVARTLSTGKVRHGIVGAVDLEYYDYHKGSKSAVRATEGTVLSRIPPRIAVREKAALEMPHILLLVDDAKVPVLEIAKAEAGKVLYESELMLGGGSIKGQLLSPSAAEKIADAISSLGGEGDIFVAVGDGNHSLATAKACYENLKAEIGPAALTHPARYALAELCSLRDPSLAFEPIHRVLFDVDIKALKAFLAKKGGSDYCITMVTEQGETPIYLAADGAMLAVGALQNALDAFLEENKGQIDYVHGDDVARTLGRKAGCAAFLLPTVEIDALLPSVQKDGVLPRKTFSMGHAEDKRYYIECRKIK
jgi:hypothetical protein